MAQPNPLGRTIEFGNMDDDLRPLTVWALSATSVMIGWKRRPVHHLRKLPPAPTGARQFTTVLRADTDPAAVIAAAREFVRSLDPSVPPSFSTLTDVFASSLKSRRFNLILVAVFAGTALLLAMAGIYGVMAYA